MASPFDNEETELLQVVTRFVSSRSERKLQPLIEEIRQAMTQLQTKVSGFASAQERLDARLTALELSAVQTTEASARAESRLNGLEEGLSSKADAPRVDRMALALEELVPSVADLKVGARGGLDRIQGLEALTKEMQTKMDSASQQIQVESRRHQEAIAELSKQQTGAVKVTAEELQKLRSSCERTSVELSGLKKGQLQQLTAALTSTEGRLGEAERSLQEKVGAERFQQMEARLPKVEQGLVDSTERLQLVETSVGSIESRAAGVEHSLREKVNFAQIRQFEGVVTSLQTQLSTLQQLVGDKVGASQLTKLRADLNECEGKLTDLEQGLHEKVGMAQMHQLKTACTSLETKLGGVEQALQEKVGSGTITQIKGIAMNLQSQIAGIEQSVKEKVGGDQIQQVRGSLAQMQNHFGTLEQSLQEKVNASQLQQLQGVLNGYDSKMSNFEQTLRDRLPAIDLQMLSDTVNAMQGKLTGVERAVWEGMDFAQTMETALASVKAQSSGLEQAVRDKASSQDLLQFSERVGGVASKLSGIERALAASADRSNQVEETIGGIVAQLGALRGASGSGSRVVLELENP